MAQAFTLDDDGSGVTAAVVVEISNRHQDALISAVTLRASNGNGVTPEDLQHFAQRINSISATLGNARAATATRSDSPPQLTVVGDLSPSKAAIAAKAVAKPARKTAAARSATPAKKAPTKPAQPPARTKAAARVTIAAPAKKTSAKPKNTAAAGRQYRRAPADAALVLDYKRFHGSIGRIAEAHDVPRYTAQRWITRLRRNNLV